MNLNKIVIGLALSAALGASTSAMAEATKPTIVLVHGAFADSTSWNVVIKMLEKIGRSCMKAQVLSDDAGSV